jgi:hypothetical protein
MLCLALLTHLRAAPCGRHFERAGLARALLQDDGKIQKTRTSPEFFGEISLLSDDNRITATAIARTNCECFTLQVWPCRFSVCMRSYPGDRTLALPPLLDLIHA